MAAQHPVFSRDETPSSITITIAKVRLNAAVTRIMAGDASAAPEAEQAQLDVDRIRAGGQQEIG